MWRNSRCWSVKEAARKVTLAALFDSCHSGDIARGAFRDFFPRARPRILEPIMKLSVEGPAEYSGNILSTIMQRRGVVIGSTEEDGLCRVDAEVPLAEMFGYSTALRSATQGRATYTMEFKHYVEAPKSVADAIVSKATGKDEKK